MCLKHRNNYVRNIYVPPNKCSMQENLIELYSECNVAMCKKGLYLAEVIVKGENTYPFEYRKLLNTLHWTNLVCSRLHFSPKVKVRFGFNSIWGIYIQNYTYALKLVLYMYTGIYKYLPQPSNSLKLLLSDKLLSVCMCTFTLRALITKVHNYIERNAVVLLVTWKWS